VTFSGRLGNIGGVAPEIFQFGMAFSNPVASPFLTRGDLPPIALAMTTRWQGLAVAIHSFVTLKRVRIALMGDDGKVVREGSGAFVQGDADVTIGGATAGFLHAPQIALVHTLQSGFPGPTGRGRFYLPSPAVEIEPSTGVMTALNAQAFADRARVFLNAITGDMRAAKPAIDLVVPSGGSVTRALPPQLHKVTSVQVGRALDTQRRRRNALTDARSKTDLTP
jgi:hypothetical protein